MFPTCRSSEYHTWHQFRLIAVESECCQLMKGSAQTLLRCTVDGNTHSHIQTHTSQTTLCNEISTVACSKVSSYLILVGVEKVLQVVDGNHQIRLVHQTGGGHAIVCCRTLRFCTCTNTKTCA